jgi:diaminopropionate ammonia-lyase
VIGTIRWRINEAARGPARPFEDTARPRAFHRRWPGYAVTPLPSLPAAARAVGVGEVRVKVETVRMGLPSFKILGASWAVARLLAERAGGAVPDPAAMAEAARRHGPSVLISATDGNHGRAVARVARVAGIEARIHVPATMAPARVQALRTEGATVIAVDGGWDDAVKAAAAEADGRDRVLIQDSAWPGYDQIPAWVVQGYATLAEEVDEAWPAGFDAALLPLGNGSLGAALVARWRVPGRARSPRLLGVEPMTSACCLASSEAGAVTSVAGGGTLMVGLDCGTPSHGAWPVLRAGLDAFCAVDDACAAAAVRLYAAEGLEVGESGAAGLAALLALAESPGEPLRHALGLGRNSRILLLATEGVTDPGTWRRLVGRDPVFPG